MKKLHRSLLTQVLVTFSLAILVFSFFMVLGDLFQNLSLFMKKEVDFFNVLAPSLYFLPKAISFSLSLSLLFAVSFTMGNLYANNELIAILSSGFSLRKLVYPLIFLGLFISIFGFFFEDHVVIPSLRTKNEMTAALLKTSVTTNANNVTVYSDRGRILYNAVNYNDAQKRLTTVIVLKKGENSLRRMDAETAVWTDTRWILRQVRVFDLDKTAGTVSETWEEVLDDPELVEPPTTFRRQVTKIEEMTMSQAAEFIQSQKNAGFPTLSAETNYWLRISFSLTPLIVAFLSSAIGGRFKKNILIFSLFVSLVIGVVYYVLQMLFGMLAERGILPVLVGAWGHFVLAALSGVVLFRYAKT